MRICRASREWWQLRVRLREERQFHIDHNAADLRALGLSERQAKRIARARFGSRAHGISARREIGGDCAGLLRLLRAHRVTASIWVQPIAWLAAAGVLLLASPAPRLLIESVAGRSFGAESTVYFSAPAPWPLSSAITAREFAALHSLRGVRGVERYRTLYARAEAVPGATPAAIEHEARLLTRNNGLSATTAFEQERIGMGPAVVTWSFALIAASFLLGPFWRGSGIRLVTYALFLGLLNILTSLIAWALAGQVWGLTAFCVGPQAGIVVCAMFVVYLLSVAVQFRCWSRNLVQRCPVCLEQLLLTSTEGSAAGVLLHAPISESVCAHGHGTLVESLWERRFRADEFVMSGLVRNW